MENENGQRNGGETFVFNSINPHPLNIHHIVAKVLGFVDVGTLKEARQVSKLWRCEGTAELLAKSYICSPRDFIYTSKERQEELKSALSQLISVLSSNIRKPLNALLLCFWDDEIFEQLNDFYPRLKSLNCSINFTMEHLYKVLVNSSNLEVLDTKILCLSPDQQWLKCGDNDFGVLLNKLKSLKEINLHFELTVDVLKKLVVYKEALQAVQEIYISGPHSMAVYIDAHLEWKIKRLHLHFLDISRELCRFFLEVISESLQSLTMIFFYCSVSKISFTPWKDEGSHIPLSLQQLQKLDFMTNALNSNDPVQWRTLITALQLPRLKTLIVRGELAKDFDKIIDDWNCGEKKLTSNSIKEVVLCQSTSSPKALSFDLWPNLVRLGIRLDRYHASTVKNLQAIFNIMSRQLEELNFQLTCTRSLVVTVHTPPLWDELLTGGYQNQEESGLPNEGNDYSSIQDMKSLKRLSIQSCCNDDDCVTDVLIHRSLVHMKNLQSLHLSGKNISSHGVDRLRGALGVTVHVSDQRLI